MAEGETKFLTVIGRAHDVDEFAEAVALFKLDNFNITIVEQIDFEEKASNTADRKVRFIAFLSGQEQGLLSAEAQALRYKASHGDLNARVYNTAAEAAEDARIRDGFLEEVASKAEAMHDHLKKFKPFNLAEMSAFGIFDALYRTKKLTLVPGIYNEEQVLVLAYIVNDQEEENILCQPLAILITNNRTVNEIQTPYVIE